MQSKATRIENSKQYPFKEEKIIRSFDPISDSFPSSGVHTLQHFALPPHAA